MVPDLDFDFKMDGRHVGSLVSHHYSTLEEGRADLVALYFMLDEKMLDLGLRCCRFRHYRITTFSVRMEPFCRTWQKYKPGAR